MTAKPSGYPFCCRLLNPYSICLEDPVVCNVSNSLILSVLHHHSTFQVRKHVRWGPSAAYSRNSTCPHQHEPLDAVPDCTSCVTYQGTQSPSFQKLSQRGVFVQLEIPLSCKNLVLRDQDAELEET